MRRPLLAFGLFLSVGSCTTSPFAPYPRCEVDCPLPPTVPPIVNILNPAPDQPFKQTDFIIAAVTDDRKVDRVEIYWGWYKLHPGVIGGAPYAVEFGAYVRENMKLLDNNEPITFQVVAWDVEGNSDTAEVTARYDTTSS